MARVKRAVNAQKKRRTVLEGASGYRGQRSRLYRKAKEQMLHSMQYAYRDRRDRKGDFRQLWITRINAAARANGMTYNRLIQGLRLAGVEVDRKILAELAVNDETAFAGLVAAARAALPAPEAAPELRTQRSRPGATRFTQRSPRVVAARRLQRRRHRDEAGPVPRRGPAGGPRGARRRRASSSCSPRLEAYARGTRTWSRRPHADDRPGPSGHRAPALAVADRDGDAAGRGRGLPARAHGRWPRCSTAQPSPGRGAGRHRRSRQRRHGAAHGRRGRRGRGGLPRRRGRPVQRQVRAGQRGQPVPPVDVVRGRCGRPTSWRALRAAGLHGARRRRVRRRSTSTTCADGGALAGRTAWLFGSEAHGLPAELAELADAPGPGADPRPRREPEPGCGRGGVPVRFGQSTASSGAQP